jgi:hypothetical protein
MDNQPVVSQPLQQPEPVINQSQQPVNPSKRSKKPLLAVLVVIVLLAGTAYGVYAWQHGKVKTSNTKVARLQNEVSKLSKQTSPSQTHTNTTQASNPYAGWSKYTLPVEKLSFMYPSSWTLSDVGSSSTSDDITFTASDGSTFNIDDGVSNGGDGIPEAPTAAIPVTYIGQSDYLVPNYGRGSVGAGSSDGMIAGVLLQSNTNINDGPNGGFPWPTDKYAEGSVSDYGAGVEVNFILIGDSLKSQVTFQEASSNSDFKTAKLVIASMHY